MVGQGYYTRELTEIDDRQLRELDEVDLLVDHRQHQWQVWGSMYESLDRGRLQTTLVVAWDSMR